MDTPTFISELVKAIALPVTIIEIVFLLIKQILELLPLVRRLKY